MVNTYTCFLYNCKVLVLFYYTGKPVQRSLYSLLFGVTAASVCYPERAVDIVTTGYYHTASSVSQLFTSRDKTTTERVVEELKEPEVVLDEAASEAESVVDLKPEIIAEEASGEKLEILEDGPVQQEDAPKMEGGADAVLKDCDATLTEVDLKQEGESEEASVLKDEVVEEAPSGSSEKSEELVVVNIEDAAPVIVGKTATTIPDTPATTEEVVPTDLPEPYEPHQTELKEVLPSPFGAASVDSAESKDVASEMEFERTEDVQSAVLEAGGDLGQSNPEDEDMYSTRS